MFLSPGAATVCLLRRGLSRLGPWPGLRIGPPIVQALAHPAVRRQRVRQRRDLGPAAIPRTSRGDSAGMLRLAGGSFRPNGIPGQAPKEMMGA